MSQNVKNTTLNFEQTTCFWIKNKLVIAILNVFIIGIFLHLNSEYFNIGIFYFRNILVFKKKFFKLVIAILKFLNI